MTGHEFHFAENGDGPGRYRIIHFKQVDKNKFDWIQVGEYVDGNLNINLSKVQFRLSDPDPPISVCSQPCDKGQAKSFLEGEKCCFHCINCTKYQILVSETQCIDCPSGFLPDSEQIECIAIPGKFFFFLYFDFFFHFIFLHFIYYYIHFFFIYILMDDI